jgi:putative aldouronate transport system substrate-binding protein
MKRCCGTLLAAFAALGLLASCGGKTPAAGEETDSGGPYAKPLEISVGIWNVQDGFDDPAAPNDTIYNDLVKKFNVTLKPVQVTWNDWMEKFRLWAASNQLPDIFATDASSGEYKTWAAQGVIRALPDDLSAYPNIRTVMSLPSVKPWAVDGKFYKFPRMTYKTDADWINDRNIIYRKDWAGEAGWDRQPESFEEFVRMCKAVLAKHPEAVGLGQHHNGYLLIIHLGIFPQGSHSRNWAKDADGLWKPVYACEGFAEGVAQLRTLYTEGVLDPDFALLKDEEAVAKFMGGQAFAVLSGAMYWKYEDAFKKANPGKGTGELIGLIDMWPNPRDGKRYYFSETPYWSESMFRGDMNDEKMDRVLAMLDYMYSDEYKTKVIMGIEGLDYKKENGAYISLLPADQTLQKKYPITITGSIGSLSAWGQWLGLEGVQVQNSNPNIAYTDNYWREHYRRTKEIAIPTPVNYDIRLMSTPAKDKLASVTQNYLSDMVRVIMGRGDPVQEWKAVIKSYNPALEDAVREVNEQAKALGIN